MMSRWLLLAPIALLLAPGFLQAQEETKSIKLLDLRTVDAVNYDRMHEDIEIFRRILDRKLTDLYPRVNFAQNMGGMMGMQGGMMSMMMGMQGMGQPNWMLPNQPMWIAPQNTVWHQEICPTLEGVYLKGQGVVYTATLATLKPAAKAEAARPVSEWERARREVHNEKETPKKGDASKPPELSDVLLKVLAENGHHFSQLGAEESLTLVLTVRDRNAPAAAPKSAPKKTNSPAAKTPAEGDPKTDAKVRDLELLADLHLKQGKHDEAVTVLQRAVESTRDPKHLATLYRKLAQAYLAQDKNEEARAAVERAIEYLKKRQSEDKWKSEPAARPAAALPIKLIISAPKKLLDEAKDGKLSFEDFCRRAQVEKVGAENRTR